MNKDEGGRREEQAFKVLIEAAAHRERLDMTVAVFSQHPEAYEASVRRLASAAQAYEVAAQVVLKAPAP